MSALSTYGEDVDSTTQSTEIRAAARRAAIEALLLYAGSASRVERDRLLQMPLERLVIMQATTLVEAWAEIWGLRQELETAYESLEASLIDQLTSLPNAQDGMARYREIIETALAEMAREEGAPHAEGGKRTGGKVVVYFTDGNRVKLTNELLGYLAGNELIRRFADQVKSLGERLKRPGDHKWRYAGDEIAGVLLNADVKKVRRLFNQEWSLFAAGFAVLELGDTPDTVLARAQEDNHRSKVNYYFKEGLSEQDPRALQGIEKLIAEGNRSALRRLTGMVRQGDVHAIAVVYRAASTIEGGKHAVRLLQHLFNKGDRYGIELVQKLAEHGNLAILNLLETQVARGNEHALQVMSNLMEGGSGASEALESWVMKGDPHAARLLGELAAQGKLGAIGALARIARDDSEMRGALEEAGATGSEVANVVLGLARLNGGIGEREAQTNGFGTLISQHLSRVPVRGTRVAPTARQSQETRATSPSASSNQLALD